MCLYLRAFRLSSIGFVYKKYNYLVFVLQGHSGLAARRLFEVMTEGPPVVALLGPSLSSELTVVGQISPSYNVLHVSTHGLMLLTWIGNF